MSQIGSVITAGTSGVASVTAGTGINISGTASNPVINLTVPVVIANGGTNATSFSTVDGTVYYNGTSLVTTATGTSGWVLTSGGAGVAPAYAALPASSDRITGNSGGAQSPNWTIITANATPTFVGAAGTLTLDFSLTNLILGNNGSSITSGTSNTGMGFLVSPALTSGADNCAFGQQALAHATTGSSCTAIGSYSMWTATTAANNNTGLGYATLYALGTGDNNTAVGYNGGVNLTGTDSNNILIGHSGSAGLNATTKIGTSGTHTSAYIAGIDGVDLNVAKVVTMASDRLGATTLTAGAGISITPGANIVTIASTATGFTWAVTTVNASAVAGNGYIANKAGLLTMTLPASGSIGDIIEITGINTAVGWRIAQNANQQIFFGTASTTVGIAGYIEATAIRDSVRLVCVVSGASTVWNVLSSLGNITVA